MQIFFYLGKVENTEKLFFKTFPTSKPRGSKDWEKGKTFLRFLFFLRNSNYICIRMCIYII